MHQCPLQTIYNTLVSARGLPGLTWVSRSSSVRSWRIARMRRSVPRCVSSENAVLYYNTNKKEV